MALSYVIAYLLTRKTMKTAKPSNKVSRIALANNLGVYQRLLWQAFSKPCIETGITGEVLLGVAVGAITRNAFRDRNIGIKFFERFGGFTQLLKL